MYHVHLNIGSNLGDRLENIKRAVSSLRQLASVPSSIAVSDPFRSSPWGFVSSNEFINVGMSFDCVLDPELLLQATQRIQRSISSASHRDACGAYIDRIIDIDIIAICKVLPAVAADNGDADDGIAPSTASCGIAPPNCASWQLLHVDSPTLSLPHPRALQRDFVTIPMQLIDKPLYDLLSASALNG